MKTLNKEQKLIKSILEDLQKVKSKIHSDFIKIDISLIEEKIKKLIK